jgi:hypothetical protein
MARQREHHQGRGLGRVPAERDVGACAARARVWHNGVSWCFEVWSIHEHEVSQAGASPIRSEELARRAAAFVDATGVSMASTTLFSALGREGRAVTPAAVANAVSRERKQRASRASSGDTLSADDPCATSVLKLALISGAGDLLQWAHLPGSESVAVPRGPRPALSVFYSRGAEGSAWHKEEVHAGGIMYTVEGDSFFIVADLPGLERYAAARVWYYDASYKHLCADRNAACAALTTVDESTLVAQPAVIIVLGNQSGRTLAAALSALDLCARRRNLVASATTLMQDNNFKEWAAFCFVFGMLLWRKLCLWHLIVALATRLAELFNAESVRLAEAAGVDVVERFVVCPLARSDFVAGRITRAQAISRSCDHVANALSAILKQTHAGVTLAALEGFYIRFKCVPGLCALLESKEYNDMLAVCNCFLDARACDALSENVRRVAYDRTRRLRLCVAPRVTYPRLCSLTAPHAEHARFPLSGPRRPRERKGDGIEYGGRRPLGHACVR